ncbi:MAG: hypothetical protein LBP59_12920 [Planctomycetaceae bacterium]|nr:hypothetical protein [Planctomycetaceae bacterium]
MRRFGETPPTWTNEFLETPLWVCLSANCRRGARDPLVSPAFQDRTRDGCDPEDGCVRSQFFY